MHIYDSHTHSQSCYVMRTMGAGVQGAQKAQLTRLGSPVDYMCHVSCVACNFIFLVSF